MQSARLLPDWRGDCERHINGSPGNQEAGNFLNNHKPQIHGRFVSQYQSRTPAGSRSHGVPFQFEQPVSPWLRARVSRDGPDKVQVLEAEQSSNALLDQPLRAFLRVGNGPVAEASTPGAWCCETAVDLVEQRLQALC